MATEIKALHLPTVELPAVQYGKKHRVKQRKSANERGYNYRWQKASRQYLIMNPLCRGCEEQGRVVAAKVVDHITPHRDDKALFWDVKNWQPLCFSCHGRKTATEDGGFGNPIY